MQAFEGCKPDTPFVLHLSNIECPKADSNWERSIQGNSDDQGKGTIAVEELKPSSTYVFKMESSGTVSRALEFNTELVTCAPSSSCCTLS